MGWLEAGMDQSSELTNMESGDRLLPVDDSCYWIFRLILTANHICMFVSINKNNNCTS
jgi:hypothetical protein